MNWLQILVLVVQELPTLETAALDTVQFITSIVHAASNSGATAPIVASASALKSQAINKPPVAPPAPVAAPPAPAPAPATNPVGPGPLGPAIYPKA